MKTVKYLFLCFMGALDADVVFMKDIITGWVQIIVYFAVDLFFMSLTNEYYAILLTLGFILAFYGIVCLVELVVRLVQRWMKPKDRS